MPCAIEASKCGRKVLVIEKDSKAGGTLHLTGGHMSAGGTRRQAEKGIIDSKENHYDEVMEISFNSADADLVKLATDEAPNTINWLEDLGFEFAPESPRFIYGHVPYKHPRTHYSSGAGKAIFNVLQPLWEQEINQGNITFLPNHTFIDLILENNEVLGVKCKDTDQKVKDFLIQKVLPIGEDLGGAGAEKVPPSGGFRRPTLRGAGSVILTTGGYGGNSKYFAEKHPTLPPLKSTANPLCTGDGIMIAEKNNLATWGFEKHIGSLGGIELEPNSGNVDFWTAWASILTSVYRPPREIYVNIEGKRFMDENESNADTRERIASEQPEQCFYMIFDENALSEEAPLILGWTKEKIREEAQKNKSFLVANSIAELAKKTNLPFEILSKTINDFNVFVENENDKDFGRKHLKNKVETAPFYAIKTHVSVILTFGGIKVNGDLQVLNNKNEVVKNLYAAGEAIGMAATSGNAFCSGMAVTPALSFGRILGRKSPS